MESVSLQSEEFKLLLEQERSRSATSYTSYTHLKTLCNSSITYCNNGITEIMMFTICCDLIFETFVHSDYVKDLISRTLQYSVRKEQRERWNI